MPNSWVSELAMLPVIARRGVSPKEIGDVETDFPDVDLAFDPALRSVAKLAAKRTAIR